MSMKRKGMSALVLGCIVAVGLGAGVTAQAKPDAKVKAETKAECCIVQASCCTADVQPVNSCCK